MMSWLGCTCACVCARIRIFVQCVCGGGVGGGVRQSKNKGEIVVDQKKSTTSKPAINFFNRTFVQDSVLLPTEI